MAKSTDRTDVSNWVGWVYFAGIMMILLGLFQFIAGIAALANSQVYMLAANKLWILDYISWGWIHLLLGIVIATAGVAVMSGKMWGRVIGVFLVMLSAIANFAFIPVYPLWSILMVVVDGLVLYALIAHGAEAKKDLE